jgi:hypothetical protein
MDVPKISWIKSKCKIQSKKRKNNRNVGKTSIENPSAYFIPNNNEMLLILSGSRSF